MKVIYKGKLDNLLPAQRRKVEAKLAKLAKVVDGKQEREVHVAITSERHIQRAEASVNIRDHALIGIGSSPDLLAALSTSIDKLEKQVRKLRAKWRDTKRGPDQSVRTKSAEETAGTGVEAAGDEDTGQKKVFRANHRADQKPMTLEEALLELEDGRDYLVYRDAETDRLSVLLRRREIGRASCRERVEISVVAVS